MKKNINYISLLNVISCFAVVLLHTNGCFWQFSTDPYWMSANIIECLAYFAVPCFYMISGATLLNYRERYSLQTYFVKRFGKTLIPFIAWSLIGLLFQILYFHSVEWSDLSLIYIYNGVMSSSFISVYWFFPALFCIYLCIPLFAAVEKSAKKETFTYLVAAGLLINAVIPFLRVVKYPNAAWPLSVGVVSGSLIYPLIGYLISEYELSKKQRMCIYALSIAGLLVHMIGTYSVSMQAGSVVSTYKGYNNLPCILYSAGIFTWFRYTGEKLMKIKWLEKLVLLISDYTFGIYLVHMFLIYFIRNSFTVDVTSILYRLGMPFIVVPIAVLIIRIIKRIPVLRRIVP